METDRNELHAETDAARAGSTPHIVRWVLIISLFAAIALLSIIWITGAATQGDEEQHVSVTNRVQEARDERADRSDTDSIVDEGFDEIEAAQPGQADPARTVENEQQGAE